MIKKWKVLERKTVYNEKHLEIREDDVELPNGKRIKYNFVNLQNIVGIVPMLDNKTILMVKQYRYPVNKISLEIPAGYVEDGENPEEAASREVEEETGYIAGKLQKLGSYHPLPGRTNVETHLFLATGLKKTKTNFDDTEFIDIFKIDKKKALKWVVDSKITHASSVVALLRAHEKGLI